MSVIKNGRMVLHTYINPIEGASFWFGWSICNNLHVLANPDATLLDLVLVTGCTIIFGIGTLINKRRLSIAISDNWED